MGRDIEYEGMPVSNFFGQEAADEGEIEFDEVEGKFIKRRKFYDISFQLGFSYHMKT